MIDHVSVVQVVLREGGYSTWPSPLANLEAIIFEDDAVLGFVSIFRAVGELLSRWRDVERVFLVQHAERFRAAGDKSWNICSVHLCTAAATVDQQRQLRWLEENLERTRKIVAAGMVTREDVVGALLPLLPLQQKPVLDTENVTERLARRIEAIAPGVADAVLDPSVPPSEVMRLLGGRR